MSKKKIIANKKRQRGITLIALVITIVILIILATITINIAFGEDGLIKRAQQAKNMTDKETAKEEEAMDSIESLINEKITGVKIEQVTDENPGVLEQDVEDVNTYIINSIEDLVFFANDVTEGNTYQGKTVKLGTNLDFKSDKSYVNPDRTDYGEYGYNGNLKKMLTSGEGFKPIGGAEETNSFHGTFDGDNNKICSLYINKNEDNSGKKVGVGLFGSSYGDIKNIGLEMVDITYIGSSSNFYAGGILSNSYGNDIINCYVTGNINATSDGWMSVGGICGNLIQQETNIENCYNLANLTATNTLENKGWADATCGGIVRNSTKRNKD